MVPLDAQLLDLRQCGLFPHASELILAPSSPLTLLNDTIELSGLLLRQMVHAACADVYVDRGYMLTISFQGRKVLLSVKAVVAGGGQRRWGEVAVDIHVLPEILQDLNYKDPPIILHRIVLSTHVNDLWSLGCILYHCLFGSPLFNLDCQQMNILIFFVYHSFHFFAVFMFLL